jgi:hypothetical protein
MNQGLDQKATYISGEQLRERFYRPELMHKNTLLSSRPGRIYIYACSYRHPDYNGEPQRLRLDHA